MINWRKRFLEKAKEVHGDKYDYSKVEYVDSKTKVCIICPEHGEFWQEPAAHLRGYNCPKCANVKRGDTFRDNLGNFIKKAVKVHGAKYDYSKVEYINAYTKVCIICPEHGEFYMQPQNHLLGQGCPKCVGRGLNTDEIVKKFKEVHGNKYDYSKVEYKKMHDKVCIICPEHGEFWQTPSKHLLGQDCPKCAKILMGEKNNIGGNEFIKRSIEKWGDLYDYSKVEYDKIDKKVEIICKKHGSFFQRPYDHLHGHGCPVCGKLESKGEIELYNMICELIGKENVIHNDRKTLNGKEIDILIPNYNIGIEFNGLRWHSEVYLKDRYYHINKSLEASKKGIKLIHIFEDEWVNHKEIVTDKIKHLLNKNNCKEKIFARKCSVKEINKNDAEIFLNKNHIQGFTPSTTYIGCFYKDELIGVMSFLCENGNNWNLNRFSTNIKYICCGVGGKLLKYFIKKYNPFNIKSFADRRWTFNDGENIYNKLGFKFINELKPDYKYVNRINPIERIHKFNFRKETLNKRYNLPLSMTELEMTKELGYDRIWDCGLLKYIWKQQT
jgi:hypothetical protein